MHQIAYGYFLGLWVSDGCVVPVQVEPQQEARQLKPKQYPTPSVLNVRLPNRPAHVRPK